MLEENCLSSLGCSKCTSHHQEVSAAEGPDLVSGVLVVQSIRRKPSDRQFDLEMLKAVRETPWQPNPEKSPNADADRLPNPIAIEPVVAASELPPPPGPADRVPAYRRMYIRQSDLEKFGYTGGCEACSAIREGRDRQGINRSEHCRKRITEAMKSDDAGKVRLERETRREEEYIARVQEEDEKRQTSGAEVSREKRPQREEALARASPAILADLWAKRKPSKAEPAASSRESKKPAVNRSGNCSGWQAEERRPRRPRNV